MLIIQNSKVVFRFTNQYIKLKNKIR